MSSVSYVPREYSPGYTGHRVPRSGPARTWTLLALGRIGAVAAVTLTLGGCKDLTGSPALPSGTSDPSFYNTPTGARGMRTAALLEFQQAIPQYLIDTGLLTDELEDPETGASAGVLLSTSGVPDPLDERILPEGSSQTGGRTSYGNLQGIREVANQAIGALATYDTAPARRDSSKVLRGELYALEGYTEILLADLFCSGVPLSTLDYQKDFTYAPGSTTPAVYQAALAKFDTALVLGASSDSVVQLARVGQGRAYLDLGQYTVAADDVTTVPSAFQYSIPIPIHIPGSVSTVYGFATVSDREGHNGLPFRSGGDVRTAVVITVTTSNDNPPILLPHPATFPAKYDSSALNSGGYVSFPVASGIEARLIQAEAQLQPVLTSPSGTTPSWVVTLNTLRATAGLPDTTDPGATLTDPTARATARIALLFRERAYWLFVTGHRQGDLRRLLRQYGRTYPAFRSAQQVYPTGHYFAPGTGVYGTDVTAPIPTTEYANPLYTGCHDRNP